MAIKLTPKDRKQALRTLVKLPNGSEQEVVVSRSKPLIISESQKTPMIKNQILNKVLVQKEA